MSADLYQGIDLFADGVRALGPRPRDEDDTTTALNRRTRHEDWPRCMAALKRGCVFLRHGKIDKWVAHEDDDTAGMMDRTMVTNLLRANILEACCPAGTNDRVQLHPQYIGASS
ncbi:hypothetical protein D1227_06200 [Henriciella mobilis]|uniref:hypothetical protein n=1 Tax=Henriciella mobilis TaxID=2305467 RepID=UPI000E6623E0|nr:hypothetical protein [Henriciella mobilis]RIJ15997.1 hypothetical protein D1231_09400 [Henriciella mobilis]RIJ21207.1 hypothetical protein D1227_12940 [Henriciella mobilis]RIJ23092.1 hypothetical protein D1227_06200 [Henriciella mobilis]